MRALLLLSLLSVACDGTAPPPEPADAGGANDAGGESDAGSENDAGPVAATPTPTDDATQLITVVTPSWDAPDGSLRRFARDGDGWRELGPPIAILLGRSGLGWGRGLHGEGAPPGLDGEEKREGDGRSPAGLFRLGTTLGYAPSPPPGAVAPYVPMTSSLQCVEDVTSAHYNRIVDRASTPVDWDGDDRLLRGDGLYEYLVFVEQNVDPAPVPGRGSCILLHVASTRPTAGCTSMARDDLERLVIDLPESGALLVQLPESAYATLREPWGLPD